LAVSINAVRDMRSFGGIGVENAARGAPSASTRCAVIALRSTIQHQSRDDGPIPMATLEWRFGVPDDARPPPSPEEIGGIEQDRQQEDRKLLDDNAHQSRSRS
jgi:hypothetical protein